MMLCDDILRVIIAFLDDECIILARVCKRWHRIVHDVHKTMLMTYNVFEAMRCGSMLSLTNAELPINANITSVIRHMSIDMLIYLYNKLVERDSMDDYDDIINHDGIINDIVCQICKMGKLIFTPEVYHRPSLIVHAITHGKRDLLKYMEDKDDIDDYLCCCAYGYAKIGDYNNFMLYYRSTQDYGCLKYYACIGRNEQIMKIANVDTYNRQRAMITHHRDEALLQDKLEVDIHACAVQLAKRDDIELFVRVNTEDLHSYMIGLCIKYNALNIMKYIISINIDIVYSYIRSVKSVSNINMTIKMAELLLEYTNNDPITISLIVHTCNYRLTEMLRARGLYSKQLTMRSSHREFTI